MGSFQSTAATLRVLPRDKTDSSRTETARVEADTTARADGKVKRVRQADRRWVRESVKLAAGSTARRVRVGATGGYAP